MPLTASTPFGHVFVRPRTLMAGVFVLSSMTVATKQIATT
jgi:hypothetical protein